MRLELNDISLRALNGLLTHMNKAGDAYHFDIDFKDGRTWRGVTCRGPLRDWTYAEANAIVKAGGTLAPVDRILVEQQGVAHHLKLDDIEMLRIEVS
jgi:hypothetical protein